MLTAIVLLLFVPATLMEWLTVLKHSEKKVKVIHIAIMLISFVLLILYSLSVTVPSPSEGITQVIEAIFHLED
ncbi:MAG: hypothetical protein GXY67_06635 [Clostridiales bacterium]|nr:hypothetical protein [Clostridiales bacterium]